jgi:type II secretion system protein N
MKLAFPTGFRAFGSSLSSGPADERKQKVLLGIGYVLFFVLCFVLAAYFTFPYERLRDILVQRFSSASDDGAGAKTDLQIAKLSPHWLTGIALEGVKLELTEPGSDPTTFEIDEITLNVAPIAFMLGTVKVSYSAEAGDGSIEGVYESDREGKERHVTAELDELDLGKIGAGAFIGIPVTGKGTGTIDLNLSGEASASEGDIDLEIEDLTLGDGKARGPGISPSE